MHSGGCSGSPEALDEGAARARVLAPPVLVHRLDDGGVVVHPRRLRTANRSACSRHELGRRALRFKASTAAPLPLTPPCRQHQRRPPAAPEWLACQCRGGRPALAPHPSTHRHAVPQREDLLDGRQRHAGHVAAAAVLGLLHHPLLRVPLRQVVGARCESLSWPQARAAACPQAQKDRSNHGRRQGCPLPALGLQACPHPAGTAQRLGRCAAAGGGWCFCICGR